MGAGMTWDIFTYTLIPLILICLLIKRSAETNIRFHTMLAVGIVVESQVKTVYIYIGFILISIHGVKKKKSTGPKAGK